MEHEIHLKHKQFESECDDFLKKIFLCRRIVSKITSAVYKNEVREEANIQTAAELQRLFDAVNANLGVFMELFQLCSAKADSSFDKLVSIENDLTLFTYKRCDLKQYKLNMIGECVVKKIGSAVHGRCHINNLKEPEPSLANVCKENLTKFPESGEIFAVKLENQEIVRAVRSDLIFKERSKIIVYLLDAGKRIEIPYNLRKFYSLPQKYRDMESRAIPCKVVELIGVDGSPLDIELNLPRIVCQTAYFHVKSVENYVLGVSLHLKDEFKNETNLLEDSVIGTDLQLGRSDALVAAGDNTEEMVNNCVTTQEVTRCSEFICETCQAIFLTKNEIEAHMTFHIPKRIAPKSKKKAESQPCGKKLDPASNSKVHLQFDNDEKPFKCSICETRFAYKQSLLRHAITHNITCKWCDASFSGINKLKLHIESHHNREAFMCQTCGKMYTSKYSLSRHLNSHTKEKSYPCEKCGKIFFNKGSQKKHLVTHSVKKFPCRLCSKKFYLKCTLNTHLKSHLGEKPFSCKICSKGFCHKRSLIIHLNAHEKKKMI